MTNTARASAEAAARRLGFQSTEIRGRDAWDFHDVCIENLMRELEAAYEAGYAEGKAAAN